MKNKNMEYRSKKLLIMTQKSQLSVAVTKILRGFMKVYKYVINMQIHFNNEIWSKHFAHNFINPLYLALKHSVRLSVCDYLKGTVPGVLVKWLPVKQSGHSDNNHQASLHLRLKLKPY